MFLTSSDLRCGGGAEADHSDLGWHHFAAERDHPRTASQAGRPEEPSLGPKHGLFSIMNPLRFAIDRGKPVQSRFHSCGKIAWINPKSSQINILMLTSHFEWLHPLFLQIHVVSSFLMFFPDNFDDFPWFNPQFFSVLTPAMRLDKLMSMRRNVRRGDALKSGANASGANAASGASPDSEGFVQGSHESHHSRYGYRQDGGVVVVFCDGLWRLWL